MAPEETGVFPGDMTTQVAVKSARVLDGLGGVLFFTQVDSSITDQQTDIFVFDLETGVATNLTQSRESEYSPTPVPNQQKMSRKIFFPTLSGGL